MSAPPHTPVLLDEAMAALAPRAGEIHVDGTYGAGGYARAILAAGAARVIAFDRDPRAIAAAGAQREDRLTLIERPFAEIEEALAGIGIERIDGAVFDLGVSSMQLDEADRGFSFMRNGPLSMRMDGGRPDARDVVNAADARDLAAIFRTYGEEKMAGRIARAIVAERSESAIETTEQLAGIVARANPPRGAERIHPATRVFQALRIFVNNELGQLAGALLAAERLLAPAGRLVVVTFHSLEDRIVKRFLADRSARAAQPSRHAPAAAAQEPAFELICDRAIAPSAEEAALNPRARSAKLRAARRTQWPAHGGVPADYAPPLILSKPLSQWSFA